MEFLNNAAARQQWRNIKQNGMFAHAISRHLTKNVSSRNISIDFVVHVDKDI